MPRTVPQDRHFEWNSKLRETIQPGWLWDAIMLPFNRIDVVGFQAALTAGLPSLTEQALPLSHMTGYDPTDSLAVAATTDRVHGTEPGKCEAAMEVTGAGHVGGAGAVRSVQFTGVTGAPAGVDALHAPQDEVVISPAARLLQSQDVGAASRAERLAEIRSQISQGVYDTPEKLALAVDRLIQDLSARR